MSEDGKSALLLFAEGSEEIEFSSVLGTFKRAGIRVTVLGVLPAGAGSGPPPAHLTGSRGLRVIPDAWLGSFSDSASFHALVLPGGLEGAKTFSGSAAVGDILRVFQDRLIGVICASPIALKAHGIGKGRRLTSHPSVKPQLEDYGVYQEDIVVQDGNLVTSRGPGTALHFAMHLVQQLVGEAKLADLRAAMVLQF